ncbi:MAG: hypothetical protein JNN18_14080 [Rubrivivax sp.]|nr:hypothetical protein [Rubrivivax sp.]
MPARWLHAAGPPVRRVGVVWTGTGQSGYRDALLARLQRAGVQTVVHSASAHELVRAAADAVAAQPALIVAIGTPAAVRVLAQRPSMPVIFAVAGDPVAVGLVASLARPGRDVTGVFSLAVQTSGKRVALLADAVPKTTPIGLLWSESATVPQELEDARRAVAALHARADARSVLSADDVVGAFAGFRRLGVRAASILTAPPLLDHLALIAAQAREHGVATVSGYGGYAEAGGLMAYATDVEETFDIVASMVHRVLAGTRAQDLPVQQARAFVLTLNLATAAALRLTLPPWFIALAQKVIR